MKEPQLSLTDDSEPPKHRVSALAGILAGFRFPGRTLERLTGPQRNAVYAIATDALKRLEEVE